MKESFLKGAHPFIKLVFLVFLMLSSFFIFSFLGVLLAIPLFHTSVTEIMTLASNVRDARSVDLLKYLQLVQTFSLFIIPPFVFVFLEKERISRYFGFDQPAGKISYLVVFVMVVALMPVNNFLSHWNQNIVFPEALKGLEQMLRAMEKSAEELTRAFMEMRSWGGYLFNIFLIALLPAVGEELTFRGVIQPLFIRWTRSAHAGIIITGAIFSFFHFQFFGFVPRWLLGIVFGYLFYWSRTLWVPMTAHFFNNALAVTAYWLAGSEQVEQEYDSIGVKDIYLLAGMIILALSLWWFYRNRKEPLPDSGITGSGT